MRETRYTNSMREILENSHLADIISMGSIVVPLILKDLEAEPKHWFYALHKLTGADPVSEDHAGTVQKMRADWLAWGRNTGLVV